MSDATINFRSWNGLSKWDRKYGVKKRAGVVLRFKEGVSEKDVRGVIRTLDEMGVLESAEGGMYNDNLGAPVWYIP